MNNFNIKSIIQSILDNKNEPEFFGEKFGKKKIDNGYGSVFYTPYNLNFVSICVTSAESRIKQVEIIGTLDLTFKDLKQLDTNYSETFSPKDEIYFYSFNINKDYTIICMSDYKIKNEIDYIKRVIIRLV